jgi:MFS family permease
MIEFFFIYLGNLINYVDRGVVSTLLPTLEQQFDLSRVEEGLVASSFMIGYATCSLLFTYLSNHICSKKLLLFGNGMWCLSAILMTFANNKNALFIARSLSGVGEASYQSLVPRMLCEYYGEIEGAKKSSIFYTAITIGTALGLMGGGFCDLATWRYLYLVEVIVGLIVLIGQWKTFHYESSVPSGDETGVFYSFNSRTIRDKKLEDVDNHHIRDSRISECSKISMVFSQPDWLFITAINTCLTFANGTLLLWLPTLYRDLYVDKYPYSFISGMVSLACLIFGIIGSILGDRLPKIWYGDRFSDSINIFRMGIYASIALVPMLLLTIMMKNVFWLSVGGISLTFAVFSFIMIPNSLVPVRAVPVQFQSYSVSFNILMVHFFGDMPSPMITSAIWDSNHNLQLSLLISMSSILGAIVLYYLAYRKHANKKMAIEKRERFRQSLAMLNTHLVDRNGTSNDTAGHDSKIIL